MRTLTELKAGIHGVTRKLINSNTGLRSSYEDGYLLFSSDGNYTFNSGNARSKSDKPLSDKNLIRNSDGEIIGFNYPTFKPHIYYQYYLTKPNHICD